MEVFAVDNEKNTLHLFMIYLKGFTKYRLYIYVTAMVIMYQITISLIFLIMISMVLPTSAIMYASGQSTDNSDDSSTGGSTTDNSGSSTGGSTTDNSGSSTGGSTTDNSGSSTGGSTTDNSGSSTGGSTIDNSGSSTGGSTTDNSGSSTGGSTNNGATLPTTSTASNGPGIVQHLSAEDIKGLLKIHNRERAAIGAPPLVWNDAVAAHAQAWAKYLADGNPGPHCIYVPGWEKIESCTHHEGENIALRSPHNPTDIPQMAEGWVSEKKDYHGGPYNDSVGPVTGHYTAMVWKSTKDVGCGFAYNNKTDFLSCRYIPAGNFNGQMPY